jgi:ribosome-binding factor A
MHLMNNKNTLKIVFVSNLSINFMPEIHFRDDISPLEKKPFPKSHVFFVYLLDNQ